MARYRLEMRLIYTDCLACFDSHANQSIDIKVAFNFSRWWDIEEAVIYRINSTGSCDFFFFLANLPEAAVVFVVIFNQSSFL